MNITTILADPPWRYGDKLRMSLTRRSAGDHYPTLSVAEICDVPKRYDLHGLPLAEWLAPAHFLFLWTTSAFLLDGSAARVCEAWGFRPVTKFTWVKGRLEISIDPTGRRPREPRLIQRCGMGHYARNSTEDLVLAVRPGAKALIKDRSVRTAFVAPPGAHSAKPDASYDLIERLAPGPYLELFARRVRRGWRVWGNDVKVENLV